MGCCTALLLAFVMMGSASGQSSSLTAASSSADQKKSVAEVGKQQLTQEKSEQPMKDNAEEDALALFETILNGEKEITKDEGVIVTSDDDDNNEGDDDDDGDDNDEDEDEIDEDIASDPPKSLAPDMQIRRQGYPDFDKKDRGSSFQQRQDAYNPNPHASPFDSSPLLHLTQGGYQRSYSGSRRGPFDDQMQNSPEHSETAERPFGTQSDGHAPPQIVPQVTYTSASRPQMDNGAVPPMFLHHPLGSSGPFINTNGAMSNGAPNGFFGEQPSPYPVFTSSNIHSPSAPRGFSDASRKPNELSQYQIPSMVNPNLLFRSPPQFVQTQSTAEVLQRPALNSFQTSSFTPYAGMNDVADSSRPDYYTYFRSPFAMSLPHFQGNPNFYNSLPAAFNTPVMPGSSKFSSYPVVGVQITPPNTNQQDRKQQQNYDIVLSDKRTQDSSDQIDVLPDKEDPVISVPFGTRVLQRSEFPSPPGGDVYIRYPTKEAGYATEEENLPSRNATTEPLLRPFRMYPEGEPFFTPARSPIVLPERRYPFLAPPQQVSVVTPACAKDTNASLCFKDPEYPRRELLYALNSDSFLLERLVASDQRLEGIPLVEGGGQGSEDSPENYVCKADLKYGTPLRARNIQGAWKVVVNVERAIGGGKFIQPIRLEVCRGGATGDPCSLATDLRTRCVQKYSLQRLLSWSADKGVHNDVYRLPVACSCQVVTGDR